MDSHTNQIANKNQLNVLVFLHHYFPGYKSGGPVRSLSNLIDELGDQVNFLVLTQDRDLGDSTPYPKIKVDDWVTVGKAKVYYSSSNSFLTQLKILRNVNADLIYLNSFFDKSYTIQPLLARYLRLIPNCPVILAPRGEFSPNALRLKWWKKNAYLRLAKATKLVAGITWHASSQLEADDIAREFTDVSNRIAIAGVVAKSHHEAKDSTRIMIHTQRAPGAPLRLLFVSRISPMKNLAFALRVLASVKASVEFDIVGPIGDEAYWRQCQLLISQLPSNVSARYQGPISPSLVGSTMSSHDLFFFPTLGENFGHVIAEALLAGTPALIATTTPWRSLEDSGAGWDIPLDAKDAFVTRIDECFNMPPDKYLALRESTLAFAKLRLSDPKTSEETLQMFRNAVAVAIGTMQSNQHRQQSD